jgi:spermidine dehydrogenase
MSDHRKAASLDRQLGMDQPITRRDFLNGVAMCASAVASNQLLAASNPLPAQAEPDYYPPALTGMRGSHAGSFEAAHAIRDGRPVPTPIDSDEHYDLVVVGAGISGLAAAHFYRARTSPNSRILILDNHDDFGGHAKRNEFTFHGHPYLSNGGTQDIDSPRPYSKIATDLLETLGIDVAELSRTTQHPRFYQHLGLQMATFFDKETFGSDKLVVGTDTRLLEEWLQAAPLSRRAQKDIIQVETGGVDYLPGVSSDEKKERLSRMSYAAFLRELVGADPAVLRYYDARVKGEWCVGIDAVSALDCWGFGLPGFKGMKLSKGSIGRMGFTPAGYEDTGGSSRLHFPDGNATIARLLVRNLIPTAVPGRSVTDIVSARVNYGELDRVGAPVRLRLNSTVARARNLGDARSAREVEVTYLQEDRAYSVRASGVVMAGWNMMIPYICPELPSAQREALHQLVKMPLVYTNVALRSWEAFDKLKVYMVHAPGSYHSWLYLTPHVDIGAYRSPRSPTGPIVAQLIRTPCHPGLPEHEQNRLGRAELLATPFEAFERNIREQMSRTLHDGGFDPARDITAITVNRWPHGYAPEYNPLFDPDVPDGQRAHVLGRRRFGRITIANADSGGGAYTDVAIDQGHRAAMELLE